MFTIFLEHKLLSGFMFFFLLLSIICQIVVGVIYRRLIRETENMSSTENKILKQCKLKFTNCFQLNGGVSNIPVFVDKFISRVTVMRITLRGLQHLSGQMMLLSVLAAGIGACLAIIRGETIGRLLPYYVVSFLGLYAYFAVSGMVDIQGKKDKLKVHLIDYLENHMVNKLRQTALDQILIAPEPEQESASPQLKTRWTTNRSIPESEQWQTATIKQEQPEIDYIPVKNTDPNINKINTPETPQDSAVQEKQTPSLENPQKDSKKPKVSALLKKSKQKTPKSKSTPEALASTAEALAAPAKTPASTAEALTATPEALASTAKTPASTAEAPAATAEALTATPEALAATAGTLTAATPETPENRAADSTYAKTQTPVKSSKHQEAYIQESAPTRVEPSAGKSTQPKEFTADQTRKKTVFSQQEKKELEELLQEFLVL